MHEEINLVSDLALILISAGITTLIFRRLKQPLVLGYIVAGFLISPYFELFPTVIGKESVSEWSEIGIIFLLFALGLEFSFKKLLNVGGTAVITAMTEIIAMLSVGFLIGHFLGWTTMESIFLGGMLAMSSTTIIIKAFDDLGLRKQKFTTIVFGTLVVEDIVAILMMVMLSTIAISQSVDGGDMIINLLKLAFFLVLCFIVGIYVFPTFFRYARKWMNNETLLIMSIGLCFGLVVLATHLGFSAALGAFIMGSILAETIEGEHIEHLIQNIKDLFGAIFFVSVGMMVNPAILVDYWFPILILTIATIFGKSLFSSVGVLLSGQPLKVSLQSGFSLAQIGEFAFIIAALGHSLGVLREFIYPVIVTISVITTFTTPYFIRLANPFYDWLNPKLPVKFKSFLDNYSAGGDLVKDESDWKKLLKYYLTNFIIYSVLIIAVLLCFTHFVYPFTVEKLSNLPGLLVNLINALITLVVMLPFLIGLLTANQSKKELIKKIYAADSRLNQRKLTVLSLFRIFIGAFWVMSVLFINFHMTGWSAFFVALAILVLIVFLFRAQKDVKAHWSMEEHFMANLNQKEDYEKQMHPLTNSINTSQLSNRDVHLESLTVSPDSPFIGKKIKELELRKNYGVNIVKITRGQKEMYFPGGDEFVYPSDQLMAIGTDEQIASFTNVMEMHEQDDFTNNKKPEIKLSSFVIESDSPLLGKNIGNCGIRDIGCMIVGVDRNKESFVNPDMTLEFREGDIVWIVGATENARKTHLLHS